MLDSQAMVQYTSNKAKLQSAFAKTPIIASLLAICGILAALIVVSAVVINFTPSIAIEVDIPPSVNPANIIFWLLFSVPAIALLGIITDSNGFRFVFSTKGFAKGLFAIVPTIVLALMIGLPYFVATIYNFGNDTVAYVAWIALHEFARVFFEELLLRGLLMTAFLIFLSSLWSKTVAKRVVFVLLCGLAFGVTHIGGGVFVFLFATVFGVAFCAAYVYSKNILVCVVVHWIGNTGTGFLSVYSENFAVINFVESLAFMAFYPVILGFAVFLAVKAGEFRVERDFADV
ncbi:MAG: CPBP family intramembrane metalloprotease [Defluviitaleaceae bacterium]|nr:CPBP family intramembrane metalloprotease [Defluviitaleaceae bacterium]